MRRSLRARVRPLVDRFRSKLLELADARLDAEVRRIEEALEVALSSYESDAAAPDWWGDFDREHLEPVATLLARAKSGGAAPAPDLITAALGPELAAMLNPTGNPVIAAAIKHNRGLGFRNLARKGQTSDVPASAEAAESKSAAQAPVSEAENSSHGAPRASGNGGFVRGEVTQATVAAVQEPAVAAEQGSTSSPPQKLRKDGHRQGVTVCSKCGYVGGNARGCGKPTGHPTRPPFGEQLDSALNENCKKLEEARPALAPRGLPTFATSSVPPPPVRAPSPATTPTPYNTAKAKVDRLATLKARNAGRPTDDKPVARVGEDDPADGELWTDDEFAVARDLAESHKHASVPPEVRSSFEVEQSGGGLAKVQEID